MAHLVKPAQYLCVRNTANPDTLAPPEIAVVYEQSVGVALEKDYRCYPLKEERLPPKLGAVQ